VHCKFGVLDLELEVTQNWGLWNKELGPWLDVRAMSLIWNLKTIEIEELKPPLNFLNWNWNQVSILKGEPKTELDPLNL